MRPDLALAFALGLATLSGCDSPSRVAPETSAADAAPADSAADAPPDADAPTDTSPTDASSTDTSPTPCASADDAGLLRALRAPRVQGVSAVAAPGQRFEDLRARFDASPVARSLLGQARSAARAPALSLLTGDTATYQTVATRALSAALVAWHDHDASAGESALRGLAAAAVSPEWLRDAQEVPIRVGASLVVLAAAADLLSASTLSPAQIDSARASVGRAAFSVEAWLQSGGTLVMLFHTDNHGMRLGSGLIAASLVAPESAISDDVLGYALAQVALSMRRQTGGDSGWAEGSTYYAYAFEVAAVALYAVDRAWTGEDRSCVRCPGHPIAACATAPVEVLRPSRDPMVADLVRWGASLESRGGWLHPFDDSRLSGLPAPLLEQLVNFRAFSRWSPSGPPGSLGGSVNVGPLVALALASPEPAVRMPVASLWPSAGTARLDGTTVNGAPLEVFLLGEHGAARDGAGHERPDALGLTLAVDGALMLGASGYHTYDDRFALARADASSVITVEGVLSRSLGAGEAGPESTLSAEGAAAVTSRFEEGGVSVARSVSIESGALVVRDRVEVTGAARDVAWHWHLRGALDAARWSWTLGVRRCEVTQEGEALTTLRETAPHADTYGLSEMHSVLRQSVHLDPGDHSVLTRIACR